MEKKKTYLAYEVIFENGKPTLSESAYQTLLLRGVTEEQIQLSLGNLAQKLIERGQQSQNVNQPVIAF